MYLEEAKNIIEKETGIEINIENTYVTFDKLMLNLTTPHEDYGKVNVLEYGEAILANKGTLTNEDVMKVVERIKRIQKLEEQIKN